MFALCAAAAQHGSSGGIAGITGSCCEIGCRTFKVCACVLADVGNQCLHVHTGRPFDQGECFGVGEDTVQHEFVVW